MHFVTSLTSVEKFCIHFSPSFIATLVMRACIFNEIKQGKINVRIPYPRRRLNVELRICLSHEGVFLHFLLQDAARDIFGRSKNIVFVRPFFPDDAKKRELMSMYVHNSNPLNGSLTIISIGIVICPKIIADVKP